MSSVDRKICRNNTDVIAELRNSVYEVLTADYEGCVQRIAPNLFSFRRISSPASIFSFAHVCQKLRKEFLSHLLATLEIGLSWLDVKHFCWMTCSTFSDWEWLSTRAPKSITVYINEFVCHRPPIVNSKSMDTLLNHDESAAQRANVLEGIVDMPIRFPGEPLLDLLPLLKLRLLREDYCTSFVLDPRANWDIVKKVYNSEDTLTDERVATAVQDLAQFMVFHSEPWTQCIIGKLDEVLLHPWEDWTDLQIELVFKEQPNESITLDSKTRRCYLPDLRRAGLRDFYATTGLTFNMRMASSSPKPDWEEGSLSRLAIHPFSTGCPTHHQTQT